MSGSEIPSFSGHRHRKHRVRKTGNREPLLESQIFDWKMVDKFNPEIIAQNEDVDSISTIISAFILCQFTSSDFDFVQVPVVFRLLRLLQVSLSYQMKSQAIITAENDDLEKELEQAKNVEEKLRGKLDAAISEIKKWKKAGRCPVCNAAFENQEKVNEHVKKYHSHVYNAWMSIRNNELDYSTKQNDELRDEILRLREQLLDKSRRSTSPPRNPSVPVEVRHKEPEAPKPVPRKLVSGVETVSIKPVIDWNDSLAIPSSILRKVEKFMNPKTRTKPETESVDEVSDRISDMLDSADPSTIKKRVKVIRKKYAEKVAKEHPMPEVLEVEQLRICGEVHFSRAFRETERRKLPFLDDNRSSVAEYSFMDPEDEQELDYDSVPESPVEQQNEAAEIPRTQVAAKPVVQPVSRREDRNPGTGPTGVTGGAADEKDPGECSLASLGPDSGADVFEDTSKPQILFDRSKYPRFAKKPSSSSGEKTEIIRNCNTDSGSSPGIPHSDANKFNDPKPTSPTQNHSSDKGPEKEAKNQLLQDDTLDSPHSDPRTEPEKLDFPPEANSKSKDPFIELDSPPAAPPPKKQPQKPVKKPKASNPFDDPPGPSKPDRPNDFDSPPRKQKEAIRKPQSNPFDDDFDDPAPAPAPKRKTQMKKPPAIRSSRTRNTNPFDD